MCPLRYGKTWFLKKCPVAKLEYNGMGVFHFGWSGIPAKVTAGIPSSKHLRPTIGILSWRPVLLTGVTQFAS